MNVGFKTQIYIQYGQLKEMLSWCEENCVGLWQYSVLDGAGKEPGSYDFQFESEEDYVNFLLWKQ